VFGLSKLDIMTQSDMTSQTISTKYVHTLLFVCPNCQFPIAITRVSEHRNLEGIDRESLRISCSYCCGLSFDVVAIQAKKHYVLDWPISE
jgi:hypothetical protein